LDKIKICIVGNSVALRIRPDEKDGKVYSSILKNLIYNSGTKDVEILNHSISRLLTTEVVDNKNHFLKNDQDITIINLGCVDAPTREIPLWFSDIIFKRRGRLLYSLFDPFYQHVISLYRSSLVRLRNYKPWVTKEKFSENVTEILSSLSGIGETVVLGINPGNQRIEDNLPMTLARYESYNEVLQSICNSNGVTFISTMDLHSEEYFPDGVHYNGKGHQLIAERIYAQLSFGSL